MLRKNLKQNLLQTMEDLSLNSNVNYYSEHPDNILYSSE